jgi:hypothetical protein
MSQSPLFEDVLAKALQLSVPDRKKLIKLLIESLDEEKEPVRDATWNQTLDSLLVTFDANDWTMLEVDDPIAWVNQRKMV